MDEELRILVLEDNPADAELVLRTLNDLPQRTFCEVHMTANELEAALGENWDIVVSDYSMPGFGAMQALEITRSIAPDLPFVVMSGTIGEERAVELLRAGVTDYIMKDRLERLVAVVQRAIRESREHAALSEAQEHLVRAGQEWLDTFNAISDGILMLDADGAVVRFNSAVPGHLAMEPDEIIGRTVYELLRSTCPESNAALDQWATGLPPRSEWGPCARTGKWFDVSCDPLNGGSGPTGFVLVFTDITQSKVTEEELREVLSKLKRTMKGTVAIAVRMVESRDPYTAGHQERVSELAVAIARRLGMDPQEIDLIRTASLLHDVGKIAVPAEILVRPGQLQPLEWDLIRRHPEVGAEILADAEFEGPIHDIVLQHHERLDGSGYPFGLKGDEIRREAQIVTVADVTEAMTAHRPYRPACSDEQVIGELQSGRGVRYAADVVDACLDHLRENGTCLIGS